MRRPRLRLPSSLVVAVASVSAAAATAGCGGTTPPADVASARDVLTFDAFEAGVCTLNPPPAGRICETVCYVLDRDPPTPTACEAYCDLPEGGTTVTQCFTAGGDPMLGCMRQPGDAGFYVLC